MVACAAPLGAGGGESPETKPVAMVGAIPSFDHYDFASGGSDATRRLPAAPTAGLVAIQIRTPWRNTDET
jgi:hypothetical protein